MLDLHSIAIWAQLTVIIDGGIGASAATIVSIGSVMDVNARYGDPTRALHAVITGIGFLGAGLIFNSKRHGVQGVTTAATVFATAAMGVSVGLGFQIVGVAFAVVIVIILRSTQVLEKTLRRQEYEYEEE